MTTPTTSNVPAGADSPLGRAAGRAAAAAELRRLAHALVAHEPDPKTVAAVTAALTPLTDLVLDAPRRERHLSSAEDVFSAHAATETHPFGSVDGPLADRPILGATNPFAVEATSWLEEREAVTDVVLGPGFEGAPKRAHGGIVAAIFDDVTGHVLGFAGTPAFTGTLTIRYHRPTPIGVPLQFRARLDGREGRRLFISADCRCDGDLLATCEAVYVVVDARRFSDAARRG